MRRPTAFFLFASLAAAPAAWSAAPQNAPSGSAEEMLDRCKIAPDICKAIAVAEASTLAMKGEACLPNNLSKEDLAIRVTDTAADAVDEAPDAFTGVSYTAVVDQIILFLWNCKERPVS